MINVRMCMFLNFSGIEVGVYFSDYVNIATGQVY